MAHTTMKSELPLTIKREPLSRDHAESSSRCNLQSNSEDGKLSKKRKLENIKDEKETYYARNTDTTRERPDGDLGGGDDTRDGALGCDTAPSQQPCVCDICGKRFKTAHGLGCHKLNQHPDLEGRDHPCPVCDAVFEDVEGLGIHSGTHPEALPYKCRECGLRLGFKLELTRHKKGHLALKYACPVCGKRFRYPFSVAHHVQSTPECRVTTAAGEDCATGPSLTTAAVEDSATGPSLTTAAVEDCATGPSSTTAAVEESATGSTDNLH